MLPVLPVLPVARGRQRDPTVEIPRPAGRFGRDRGKPRTGSGTPPVEVLALPYRGRHGGQRPGSPGVDTDRAAPGQADTFDEVQQTLQALLDDVDRVAP